MRLVRRPKEEPCPPSCPRDPNRVKRAFYFSKIIPKFIRPRFVHSFISIIDINKSEQLILTLNNNLEVIVKDFFKIFERWYILSSKYSIVENYIIKVVYLVILFKYCWSSIVSYWLILQADFDEAESRKFEDRRYIFDNHKIDNLSR